MDLDLKSSIQWICREWVRKLDSNELGNNYNGFRWKERKYGLVLSKKKCPRHSPRRSILVYIYIYLLNLVTSLVLLLIVFFSFFFNPPPPGSSFSFILSSFFHLHPPRVDHVTGFDPYPISTFLKSLGVAIRLKITIQVSLPH